jgi:hypothetical protein
MDGHPVTTKPRLPRLYSLLTRIRIQANGSILRSCDRMLSTKQMYLAGRFSRVCTQLYYHLSDSLLLVSDLRDPAKTMLNSIIHLGKLGFTTISSFVILYYPWLRPFPGAIQQVVHRMFPFARGIFEDKVANFWCASNVVVKWRRWFGVGGMARVSE